jgi:glucose/arabinose dehydrogenase
MRRRARPDRTRILAVLIGLFAVVATAAACVPPKNLSVSTVVDGLSNPWDVAWTPDGTMVFTQRSGPIDAFIGGSVRELARPSDVRTIGEGGMMGIAVDPQFSSNRFIYTCFHSSLSTPATTRVVRWRVNDAFTALTNRTDLITSIPASSSIHFGCRTRFGPDGYLWVTTGDGAIGTAPQDKKSLAGKVLRIDRNGNGAPGNPGGDFLPQIYTYGHRNPQGIAFRPYDNKAFEVEHGTGCDDEVNVLVPGGNYGWDPTTPGGGSGYDQSRPMTDVARHPDAIPASWSSGCPTEAPSGATFLVGDQWKGWNQALAVAVLKDQYLHVFGLDADGKAVDKVEWKYFQGTYGRLRAAAQGPDGDLYLLTDANPGRILRVHPSD